MLSDHQYFRIRRTWIDVSCRASRREGVLFYRPGRKLLRIIPWLLAKFAWLKWPSQSSWSDILPRFDLEKALAKKVEYVTIYIGNDTARSKFTLLVKLGDGSEVVAKVGKTDGAKAAIEQEYAALEKLQTSVLKEQTPKPMGAGTCGGWNWSAQSVLARGPSPTVLQQEHFEFLERLKSIGMSHGDFAPWNCAIVKGRLVVWDWEEAGDYVEGKDQDWFVTQARKLLGRGG